MKNHQNLKQAQEKLEVEHIKLTKMKSFSQPGFLGAVSSSWTMSPALTLTIRAQRERNKLTLPRSIPLILSFLEHQKAWSFDGKKEKKFSCVVRCT